MEAAELIARHPTLYHLADARNWTSIQKAGLMSTRRLIESFGEDEAVVERLRAAGPVRLPRAGQHPQHGTAFVRDQHQINPRQFAGCLIDMTEPQWRASLNRRVFFWVDPDRLDRMLRYYRAEEQVVLHVDTARLLEQHAAAVELSPINSGFVMRRPAMRGRDTFRTLAAWDHPKSRKVVELTVVDAVPRILEITTRVESHLGGRPPEIIWAARDS